MITVMKTVILEFDKSDGTGLEPIISGSHDAKKYPNWQSGSGLMNYSNRHNFLFDADSSLFTCYCLVSKHRAIQRMVQHAQERIC